MNTGYRKGTIIGLIKNFHFNSLHNEIGPLVLGWKRNWQSIVNIRISPFNIDDTINFIRKNWEDLSPEFPFEYSFLDENIDNLYKSEKRLAKIFGSFSLFAILIACLGLFGLAAYTTEQRTKEIGIRKVQGASVSSIVILLSKEFTKWVLLANIIAWPVAYFVMNKWLQNFAYRINIGWWMFLFAGALALVIALLTVSYQAIRAATANPVESLRYE